LRRKARERQAMFVAEGVRTVEELIASPLRVKGILTCDLLDRTPRGAALAAQCLARDLEVLRVSEREFLSASDTEHPQGILAIAEVPDRSLSSFALPDVARLLVLDGIQDPGNVGTLLRTASALGCSATLVLPGTVDPWNAKVVRSAVGMQFTHPTISCSEEELDKFLTTSGVALWGAAAEGVAIDAAAAPARLAIVMGNEGAGLKSSVCDRCDHLVAIAMVPGAESLNVAVAAGILLHALRPST
jgi:TrmH family RNA methyltransferase